MKYRLLAAILLATSAVIGLAACSEPLIGTVVSKDMTDGFMYPQSVPSCDGQGRCTTTVIMQWMPESYWVEIDTGQDKDNNGETDVRRGYVNSGTWYQTEIGDPFDNRPKDSR